MTLSSLRSALSRIRVSGGEDPVRDWLILLLTSAVALLVLIIWNIWAFHTVASGGVIGAYSATPSTQLLDPQSVRNIRDLFQNRAAEAAKYEGGAYRYTDPSL